MINPLIGQSQRCSSCSPRRTANAESTSRPLGPNHLCSCHPGADDETRRGLSAQLLPNPDPDTTEEVRAQGPDLFCGADDEIRTRDPHLGKVMLYQLSHIRRRLKCSPDPGLHQPAPSGNSPVVNQRQKRIPSPDQAVQNDPRHFQQVPPERERRRILAIPRATARTRSNHR